MSNCPSFFTPQVSTLLFFRLALILLQKNFSILTSKTLESLRANLPDDVLLPYDEDARFLEFVKHDYEKELPEKSRKLIYIKRDKERDFAILSLFLGSGTRVNELFNLSLRDLDFEEKQIHVLRKGGKKDVVAISPQIT
ncbi:tyrosine-type recombinase/integrase [Peribacillus frigoritolerans]|uniref:tyrosine-type recombinase/integrase n=1 Tax=Peribacillus frigoritolerans TaxID=450367 RepID=UPI003D2AC395